MICKNDIQKIVVSRIKGECLPSNYFGHLCLNSTVISRVNPTYLLVNYWPNIVDIGPAL